MYSLHSSLSSPFLFLTSLCSGGCEGGTAELAFEGLMATGITSEWIYPYLSWYGNNSECKWTKVKGHVAKWSNYVTLPSNEADPLMSALATQGPIAVSVDASEVRFFFLSLPFSFSLLTLFYSGTCTRAVSSMAATNKTPISTTLSNLSVRFSPFSFSVFLRISSHPPFFFSFFFLTGYGTDQDTKQDYWVIRNSWTPEFGEEGFIRIVRHSSNPPCGTDTTPLDGVACVGQDQPVTVCGTCGVLYDSSYIVV